MIDLIGDIHGHASELEALLQKLGYTINDGAYSHPTRKVLFVGDYIDRGPKIRETLQIIKAMVDSGNAIALMGNHEYNALCFNLLEAKGGHLRKHLIKNILQHYETLKQFHNLQTEYDGYLDWFKTLPLFYETDTFRAVHGCWDNKHIEYLRTVLDNGRLTDELIIESVKEDSGLCVAIDETLKGKEIKMPEGMNFKDKDGNERTDIRIKWWEDPSQMTYRSISVEPIDSLPTQRVDLSKLKSTDFYPENDKSIFFGHYWLKGEPAPLKQNVCCLDYSVAKEGKLVAYRLDEEIILDKSKMIYV